MLSFFEILSNSIFFHFSDSDLEEKCINDLFHKKKKKKINFPNRVRKAVLFYIILFNLKKQEGENF